MLLAPTTEPTEANVVWRDNGVVKISAGLPVITSQPSSTEVGEGAAATFSVTATGGTLSYQWQKSDNAGVDWANISGATASSYTTAATVRATDNSDQYRCVVSNTAGSTTSNAATLTVWNPTALTGLQLWLDGNDASTILEGTADPAENGDAVTQWSDKSGNARHATASSTGCPTYASTGRNGRGTLQFNGTSNFMTVGTTGSFNFLHNGTASLVVIVAKIASTSNPNTYYVLLDSHETSGTAIGYSLYYQDTSPSFDNAIVCQVAKGSAPFCVQNTAADAFPPQGWNVIECNVDADNATAASRASLSVANTIKTAANTATGTPSASNHTYTMKLGRLANTAAGYLVGEIAEVIICNDPNTANLSSLRNYLNQRWNVDISNGDVSGSAVTNISNQATAYEAFPSIYFIDSGLVAFWRSATNHVGSKGTITRAFSSNSGASWSLSYNVITDTEDLRDPFGIVLSNGDILLGCNINDYSPSGIPLGAKVYKSTDNGASFTQIADLSVPSGYNYFFPYGKWREKNGVIYAPFYVQKTSDSLEYSEVWKSNDSGVTWSKVSVISANYNETAIINVSGSTWIALARAADIATNRMAWFLSTDDMATWSSANLTSFQLNSVSPDLFKVNDNIWATVGDRLTSTGIRMHGWTGNGFSTGKQLYAGAATTNQDLGYMSSVADDSGAVHSLFYDEGTATNPGIYYQALSFNQ